MFKRGTTNSDRPRQDCQKTTNVQNAALPSSQEDSSSSSTASSIKQIDYNVVVKAEDQDTDKAESVTVTALECAVCLQNCVHPVKLPCSHIFCYLCVKGVAFQSKRCAMCRQEIPSDFLLYPQLLDRGQLEKDTALDDGYQWFYEGRNGWWQYDERTSMELETAYKRSQRSCELLIAGFLYVIDFDQMLQYRRTDPSRRRRIKRDLASIPKKGVAGLRLEQSEIDAIEESGSSTLDLLSVAASRAALNSNNCLSPGQTQTPQAPSNTPQTPQTPRSPPSPAPEPAIDLLPSNQQGSQLESEIANYSPRWQEPERRRLRRAMEEIERLRLNDGDTLTAPRLDHMVVYYNFDDRDIIDNQDLWPSEETSSDEEGNGI